MFQKGSKNAQPFSKFDDNSSRDMRKPILTILSFFLLAGWGVALSKSALAVDCAVTNPSGNPIDAGSLGAHLSNPNCSRITFTVNEINPMRVPVSVRPGVVVEGKEGIVLQFANNVPRAATGCLVKIFTPENSRVTPENSHAIDGVTLSHLTIRNESGAGICILDNNLHTGPVGNVIRDVVIEASTRGIDLNDSYTNTIERVTLRGLGDAATDGIYTIGLSNEISQSEITNFENGVQIARIPGRAGAGNRISKMTYRNIRNKPILYYADRIKPKNIQAAFVSENQFYLTGVVEHYTEEVEIYSVSNGGHDYEYRDSILKEEFVSVDTVRGRSGLGGNRRFVHLIDRSAANALQPDETIALNLYSVNFIGTTMFVEYNDADPLAGGSNCATTDWYWWSLDARANGSENATMKVWDFDLDGDGLRNSCLEDICTDAKLYEDRDRDCRVDAEESNPADPYSQYDFDCDQVPDHASIWREGYDISITDNCTKGNTVSIEDRGQREEGCAALDARDNILGNLQETFNSYNPPPNGEARQTDTDGNGIGDPCEEDSDADGVVNVNDNCPSIPNSDQRNSDGEEGNPLFNFAGDACEQLVAGDPRRPVIPGAPDVAPPIDDADGDGIPNLRDNCPYDPNPEQIRDRNRADMDEDGVGDACDPDIDNDGLANEEEDLNKDGRIDLGETNPRVADSDGDRICDGPSWGPPRNRCFRPLDNCPLVTNDDQMDQDEDGIGDDCDAAPAEWLGESDSDGDGILDGADNCPILKNPNQGDGIGNPCDSDDDNDGLDDATESGIFNPRRRTNPDHRNHLDPDVDIDDVVDGVDICVNYKNQAANTTCGGYPEFDLDLDGRRLGQDNCPFISNKDQADLDQDGKGNACDMDDDNDDNINVEVDVCLGDLVSGLQPNRVGRTCDYDESGSLRLHPWDPNSDHEGGNIFNAPDAKCDGNGTGFGFEGEMSRCEIADPCPEFFNESFGPGLVCGPSGASPNVARVDSDGDGIFDGVDNCPGKANRNQRDRDQDGVGDLCEIVFSQNPVIDESLTTKVQGGGGGLFGCQLTPSSEKNFLPFLGLILASSVYIWFRSRNGFSL